jgi:di/tricarboxylate transporter
MGTVVFTTEMAVVLAILAFAVYLFVFEIVRVDVAAILIMVLLGVSGLVPAQHIFDGFSSNAVISIIAIMIMGAGLDRTGVMNVLAGHILKIGGSTEKRVIPIVAGTVGVISSFMQNIGAAALFLPVVSRISTRTGIPLSRLLMPMGFCAILGGTLTMVGSSPLILLNDLILNSNRTLPPGAEPMRPFHLFAVLPVGLVLLTAGIAYFVVAGRRVLPTIRAGAADPRRTRRYFENTYGIRGEVFEAYVPLDSPLAGMTIGEAELLPDTPFIVAMKTGDEMRLEPSRDQMIWVGCVFALLEAGQGLWQEKQARCQERHPDLHRGTESREVGYRRDRNSAVFQHRRSDPHRHRHAQALPHQRSRRVQGGRRGTKGRAPLPSFQER